MPPKESADVGREGECGSLRGRRAERSRTLFAAFFLVFLAYPCAYAWGLEPARRWSALVVLAAFALWYVLGWLALEGRPPPAASWLRAPQWLIGIAVLVVLAITVIGSPGLALLSFFVAGAGGAYAGRLGLVLIFGSMVAQFATGHALGFDPAVNVGLATWQGAIGVSVWFGSRSRLAQETLAAEREQKTELAVELERARLARDLHDILGHSLTVVTVKAQLAGRLVDTDPERAKAEIVDVERLARDALADVRATVRSYRELALPAELARARQALDAAEIQYELPGATDEVRSDLRDLFAWTVREGVTNVIRHSGARNVTITLERSHVEVTDDGHGLGQAEHGNGLIGLAERARQVGAKLSVEPARQGRGTVLQVRADEVEPR
ncbi:sensor histidine kinase [Gephyromycinifex aptenodytis]|uniref:sensor histidine kinase n=1 Tax=Gephyromycinifex aptenodytis TaxID=2716227 RepID=UPI001B2FF195|nr:sensor histidine kinase [Gephyromycinifex aptenodytis]